METKSAARDFPYMMLAITGQWVTEVMAVLCLFGTACIGLAIIAGDGAARQPMEQKATERKRTLPDEPENFA